MAKTKILYIHQDGLVTGSAISLRHFLSALNKEKYEPVVLLASEGPARQLYQELGIQVEVFNFTTFWTCPGPNWYSPRNLKQYKALLPNKALLAFVKKINPQLIHINDKAALNAGVTLKKLGIPIVQHSRSTYRIIATKINKYVSARCIQSYCNELIAISEDEIDGFENFKNKHIINNTIDFLQVRQAEQQRQSKRQELQIKDDEIVIGFVGAISAHKGAWFFLEAAKQLLKDNQNQKIKFLLVGKVPETPVTLLNDGRVLKQSPKEYLANFISSNNFTDKIIITGHVADVLNIYATMDILFAINKFGAMGRQAIEAQALGIPVVANHGHSKKTTVLINNQGGLVLDNPVTTNQLVNALQQLINNAQKREEMGKQGKTAAAQRFSPAINMGKIEAIYHKLLLA